MRHLFPLLVSGNCRLLLRQRLHGTGVPEVLHVTVQSHMSLSRCIAGALTKGGDYYAIIGSLFDDLSRTRVEVLSTPACMLPYVPFIGICFH